MHPQGLCRTAAEVIGINVGYTCYFNTSRFKSGSGNNHTIPSGTYKPYPQLPLLGSRGIMNGETSPAAPAELILMKSLLFIRVFL
jgi:hypothetical protein